MDDRWSIVSALLSRFWISKSSRTERHNRVFLEHRSESLNPAGVLHDVGVMQQVECPTEEDWPPGTAWWPVPLSVGLLYKPEMDQMAYCFILTWLCRHGKVVYSYHLVVAPLNPPCQSVFLSAVHRLWHRDRSRAVQIRLNVGLSLFGNLIILNTDVHSWCLLSLFKERYDLGYFVVVDKHVTTSINTSYQSIKYLFCN